jgi:hypothetical protein
VYHQEGLDTNIGLVSAETNDATGPPDTPIVAAT